MPEIKAQTDFHITYILVHIIEYQSFSFMEVKGGGGGVGDVLASNSF